MRSVRIIWLYTVSTTRGRRRGRRLCVTLSSCFYQTIRADDGDAGLSAPYHLQTMLLLSSDRFFFCQSLFISYSLLRSARVFPCLWHEWFKYIESQTPFSFSNPIPCDRHSIRFLAARIIPSFRIRFFVHTHSARFSFYY